MLFQDVAFALELLGIPYETLNEDNIKRVLEDVDFIVVPGGYTQQYMPALGEMGKEAIRNFIDEGGGYIGICAGVYIAPGRVEAPGRPEGLGIVDIRNVRENGVGMRKIFLKQHSITEGLGKELRIYYQNGPEILAGKGVEEVASYENGELAIVASQFGQGKVVLLSPHPEGSVTQGIEPTLETLRLLRNSIEFCL